MWQGWVLVLFCELVSDVYTCFFLLWGLFALWTALIPEWTPSGSRWGGLGSQPFILWNVAKGTSRITRLIGVSIVCFMSGFFSPSPLSSCSAWFFVANLSVLSLPLFLLNGMKQRFRSHRSFWTDLNLSKALVPVSFQAPAPWWALGWREVSPWSSLTYPRWCWSDRLFGFQFCSQEYLMGVTRKQENISYSAPHLYREPGGLGGLEYIRAAVNGRSQNHFSCFAFILKVLFTFFFPFFHLSLSVWFYSYGITKTHTYTSICIHTQKKKAILVSLVKVILDYCGTWDNAGNMMKKVESMCWPFVI